MDRTYERKSREESQWLRFVARETRLETRRQQERWERALMETMILLAARPPGSPGG